jgi:hypothetical protein
MMLRIEEVGRKGRGWHPTYPALTNQRPLRYYYWIR